ncbi:hypothetical protein HAX54_042885 [Datura stramonium]|uniref:Uncharacterized protein n=1 Tax=Datura stramonium TaxID=4076 RepID=A0ABS8W2K9_DATST|nr:hypothetical protein [Datura stramonium]
MSMTMDGQEVVFDIIRASRLPPHNKVIKAIMEVESEPSNKALEQYLSQEDPHGRALVYEKEYDYSSNKMELLAVLYSTSPHVSREGLFDGKPLTWEKTKTSI